jgi:hypothetical protein
VAEPLELTYNWPFRLVVVTGAALACIVLLGLTGTTGWQTVAAFVLILWVLVGASICLRSRAFLRVEGSELTVRRFEGFCQNAGAIADAWTDRVRRSGMRNRRA